MGKSKTYIVDNPPIYYDLYFPDPTCTDIGRNKDASDLNRRAVETIFNTE